MRRELTIQEIQTVSLEILKRVADLCEELQLRYYLVFGTLIGAIRHHGYIPWDDDVDIMMPRPDHDKLMEHLSEHPLPGLTVFNRRTCRDYPYMLTRISDDGYILEMENEESVGMGIFIDVYPFDGLGNTREEAVPFGLKGDYLSSLCYQATRKHFAMETTTSVFRKIIKFPVFLISRMIGKDFFQNRLELLAGTRDYETSEYVGCVTWLTWGEKEMFLRKWFDESILVPFEKYEFRVPKCYDEVLRHEYGDYMQLPPEKDRIGHHYYKAFSKGRDDHEKR
ncbi:MAG: LicD family protein [Lachnospiraceae bacterium]|nr:LicD family protein [Lachnospiraceae bacterium]